MAASASRMRSALFGGGSKAVEVVGCSATFLFHWIPAVPETTTRLPLAAGRAAARQSAAADSSARGVRASSASSAS